MREIEIKDNHSGLRIFVNGVPDIKNIEKEHLNIIISALEKQIEDYYMKTYKKEKPDDRHQAFEDRNSYR